MGFVMNPPFSIDNICVKKTLDNGSTLYQFARTKAAKTICAKMQLAIEVFDSREDKPEIWYYEDGYWHPGGAQLIGYALDELAQDLSDLENINDVLRRVRGKLRLQPVEFDVTNPYLVGCKDGITLDLQTGKARKAAPMDLISMPIPVKYDPSARCPGFIKFLKDVMATPDDILSCIDFLASLLIAAPMDFFICAPGMGSNGRSTLKDFIGKFLGEDAVRRIPLKDLSNRFTNGFLKRCRVNYCSETEVTAVILDHVKRSGERMPVEVKFGGMQNVLLYLKYFFDTNVMPRIADNSYGADRRLAKLDLPWRFVDLPEENNSIHKKKDPYILDKISTEQELSGVLNLVLERAPEVIKKKMIHQKPDGLAEYGLQSRSGDVFIDLFIDVTNNASHKVHSNTLRDGYKNYCIITNSAALTSKGFKTVLEDKTQRKWEKSIRIDDKVNSGYVGLTFDQDLFDGTMTTLKTARVEGKPIFQTLVIMFPRLNEDYTTTTTNYYTNNTVTDTVCSLCSKCSSTIDSAGEKEKDHGKEGKNPRENTEGPTTTTKLQTLSSEPEKCSCDFPVKSSAFEDNGSEVERNTTNVVKEFLADGGQTSLDRFLAEFPEAA